jgi:hypothetical protein
MNQEAQDRILRGAEPSEDDAAGTTADPAAAEGATK